MKKRCVVLVSGNGSNLQALIDASQDGRLPVDIVLVLSNRKGAYGLTRAANANIPTHYMGLKEYKDAGKTREEYDGDVAGRILQERPDVIVLAGWMHIVSKAFLDVFGDIVINLHPALPDQFDGTHAIDRAYASYQAGTIAHTGVMVHMVTPLVDKGRVLATEHVPIHPADTLEDLENRMHQVEHRLLVQAVADFVQTLP